MMLYKTLGAYIIARYMSDQTLLSFNVRRASPSRCTIHWSQLTTTSSAAFDIVSDSYNTTSMIAAVPFQNGNTGRIQVAFQLFL